MAKTLFEAIGYRLGRKAAQAKSAFDLIGGTEEESLRAEIRLGRDLAAALLERTPLMEENETTRFAAQIGHWLAANVKEKRLPFSFRVLAEREPNAFALPGGPVFVSWPWLEMCQGQRDEIAFVLGHEMGHIVRRHTLDRIVKDAALSLLLRQSSFRQAASAWLSRVGAAGAGLCLLQGGLIGGGRLRRGSGQNRWRRRVSRGAPVGETRSKELWPGRGHRGRLLRNPPALPRAGHPSAGQEAGVIRAILGFSIQARDDSPGTTR